MKDNNGSNVTLSMRLELGKLSIGSPQDSSFRTDTTESYVFLVRIPRFAVTQVVIFYYRYSQLTLCDLPSYPNKLRQCFTQTRR